MYALLCAACGRRLEAESFAGPPRRWFATQAVLDTEAKLLGWVDNTCPDCQTR